MTVGCVSVAVGMAAKVGFGDGELVELVIGAAVAGARDTTIGVSQGSGKGVLVGRVSRVEPQAVTMRVRASSDKRSRMGGW